MAARRPTRLSPYLIGTCTGTISALRAMPKDLSMKFFLLTLVFLAARLSVTAQAQQSPPAQTPADQREESSPTTAAAQKVIQQLVAGDFAKIEAQYDQRMAEALPPGKLGESWPGLIQQEGAFESITGTQTIRVQGIEVVKLVCKFANATLDATVAFDADGKIAGLSFRTHQETETPWNAPPYAKPDSFNEQPLTLVNGKFELPGTLTLPKGDGPFPALVLVHGSGPHDRDETIGPNKPFRDLAWGLATRGVAVLRYTKRTKEHGPKFAALKTFSYQEETIDDARAAIGLLRSNKAIDP